MLSFNRYYLSEVDYGSSATSMTVGVTIGLGSPLVNSIITLR